MLRCPCGAILAFRYHVGWHNIQTYYATRKFKPFINRIINGSFQEDDGKYMDDDIYISETVSPFAYDFKICWEEDHETENRFAEESQEETEEDITWSDLIIEEEIEVGESLPES